MSKPHIATGVVFYLIALIIFGVYFTLDLNDAIYLSPVDRIIFLVSTCAAMYIASVLISRQTSSYRLFRINLIIWFILYVFLIITLTQLDRYSYRDEFDKYILFYDSRPINFIPLNTITAYTTKFMSGYISTDLFLYNILGNILALAPLAFFLPLLFKSQNNFFRFFLSALGATLAIEIAQFVTMSGTCDIDDILLNLLGACVAFAIFQIRPLKSTLHRVFLPAPTEQGDNTQHDDAEKP